MTGSVLVVIAEAEVVVHCAEAVQARPASTRRSATRGMVAVSAAARYENQCEDKAARKVFIVDQKWWRRRKGGQNADQTRHRGTQGGLPTFLGKPRRCCITTDASGLSDRASVSLSSLPPLGRLQRQPTNSLP